MTPRSVQPARRDRSKAEQLPRHRHRKVENNPMHPKGRMRFSPYLTVPGRPGRNDLRLAQRMCWFEVTMRPWERLPNKSGAAAGVTGRRPSELRTPRTRPQRMVRFPSPKGYTRICHSQIRGNEFLPLKSVVATESKKLRVRLGLE